MLDVFAMLFIASFSAFAAGLTVIGLVRYLDRRNVAARVLLHGCENDVAFLFDDVDLIDATPRAKDMLRSRNGDMGDWDRFLSFFAPHFPHLRSAFCKLAQDGKRRIFSQDDPNTFLEAEFRNGIARIVYHEGPGGDIDRAIVRSMEDELSTLRTLAEDAPQLIWKEDENGEISWTNQAYLDLVGRKETDVELPLWPPAKLFPNLARARKTAETARYAVTLPARGQMFFDITSLQRGQETVRFATDTTAVAQAEETQRNYVHTLVKTFAQLSTGLAIFDAHRQLVVFNPALLDLTGLPVDFLSRRPQINAFLDRMRDARMIPEQKDFRAWRDIITDMQSRAESGDYCEKWDLPNGQTWRVVGRPHPDGALALLFEDISDEVALTRRFRTVIDASQAVLDQLDDGIAVFSMAGTLTMSNAAYARMWHDEPMDTFLGSSLTEESRLWQEATTPTPVWTRVREAVGDTTRLQSWDDTVRLADGRTLRCAVSRLPDGAALVRFRLAHANEPMFLAASA